MGRILAALVTCLLALGPVGVEGRGSRPNPGPRPGGAPGVGEGLTMATFSLARGVIGGSVAGLIDRSYVGTGHAICFLPGTFDATVDGVEGGEWQPSSHCGHDASVRIAAFSEAEAGDEVARPMTIRWTDLAGRGFTLQFDGRTPGDTNQVRVICLDGDGSGCRSAIVDSASRTLFGADGQPFETGARARLTVTVERGAAGGRDLGIYEVPFSLTIAGT